MAKVPDNFYINQISGEKYIYWKIYDDYHPNCELNLNLQSKTYQVGNTDYF